MERTWFEKTKNGLCWKPTTWQGYVIIVIWIYANIWYLFSVDKGSPTISNTFLSAAPFFIVSTLLLLFTIRKRSGRNWM